MRENIKVGWWIIVDIANFIVNVIKFLWSLVVSLFNWFFRAFETIRSDSLTNWISSIFNQLADYVWFEFASILFALFLIALFFLIWNFIVRLLSRQVHYNSTLKHIDKQNRKSK